MKKLAAYIAVGFLSVGVASPAFSDSNKKPSSLFERLLSESDSNILFEEFSPKKTSSLLERMAPKVDCEFIEKQANNQAGLLKGMVISNQKKFRDGNFDEHYEQTKRFIPQQLLSLNHYANIYSAFCK